ncbi:MAG: hypothetical protein LBT08_07350 [Synergistaceae bacterium]|jgi:hypothetical protein|nr:hypothetical protein [Synergistaceae bacterium]
MGKKFSIVIALALLMICTGRASSWEDGGAIFGTDIEYSGMKVSKSGVDVRLTNVSASDVKVSLRLTFLTRDGNTVGYSLFGLREIPAGTYVDIRGNYLNGAWKQCKDSERMTWQRMTYELVY